MNLKKILAIAFTFVLLAFFGVGAYAGTTNPINVNNLEFLDGYATLHSYDYYGFDSSLPWDVQGLGWETTSGESGYFFAPGTPWPTLLYSKYSGGSSSSLGALIEDIDLTTAYFSNKYYGGTPYNLASNHVQIWEIDSAFTYQGVAFNAGDLVIGFEVENPGRCDLDYDELVVLARPTPIPGAIWLMGSGLLGLVGIRRKIRKS